MFSQLVGSVKIILVRPQTQFSLWTLELLSSSKGTRKQPFMWPELLLPATLFWLCCPMTSVPSMPFLFHYQMTIFCYLPSCVLHTKHSVKVIVMFIHHGLPLPLNIHSYVRCGQSSCLEIIDLPLCLCHKGKSESKERGGGSGKTKK